MMMMMMMNCLLSLIFHHNSALKDLINQGRQKVMEATNALKALPREPLEDIIGQLVSKRVERGQKRKHFFTIFEQFMLLGTIKSI